MFLFSPNLSAFPRGPEPHDVGVQRERRLELLPQHELLLLRVPPPPRPAHRAAPVSVVVVLVALVQEEGSADGDVGQEDGGSLEKE